MASIPQDELVLDEREASKGRYRIAWFIYEADDLGAVLGEVKVTKAALRKACGAEREAILANLIAAETTGAKTCSAGFYWDSRPKAITAMRRIYAALAADTGGPLPDWAVKAKAAGWTPPKGWKP